MKKLALAMVFLSVFGVGCSKHSSSEVAHADVVATQTIEQGNKVGHHLCGAPTRNGGVCHNLVSDKYGKDAKCWRHR
jgi:hypothetical protein